MNYLSDEQIIELHDALIKKFGGLSGIRDRNLLESASATPMMTVFGKEIHKSVYDKTASYLFSILRNHPFIDGNKRTASAAALLFLRTNGKDLNYKINEFEEFIVQIAKGMFDIVAISNYLEKVCQETIISK